MKNQLKPIESPDFKRNTYGMIGNLEHHYTGDQPNIRLKAKER